MANLFGKLKNRISDIVSVAPGARDRYEDDDYDDYEYEDDYDEYDDDYDDRYDESGRLQLHYGSSREAGYRRSSSRDDRASSRRGSENKYDREQTSSRSQSASSRYGRQYDRDVIPFSETSKTTASVTNVESIILRPKLVDDAVEICNHMRAGRMCIVDLTGLNNANAQRIADYLGGVCHALDGVTTRVNEGIFTVAPHSHRVMSDYREEMALDRGSFFSRAANDR